MTDHRESRLLILAAVFLFLYAAILSLSPAVRENSWLVTYRFSQWAGFLVWSGAVFIAYRAISYKIPDHDPYLLPLASFLAGWGLLTIWRLDPGFGLRQAIWLAVSVAAVIAILYLPPDLGFLRGYKYILLKRGLDSNGAYTAIGNKPYRLWASSLVGVLRLLSSAFGTVEASPGGLSSGLPRRPSSHSPPRFSTSPTNGFCYRARFASAGGPT